MVTTDEDALICDLAEIYHVYDHRTLPPYRVAALACGLREDSRIKQQLTGRYYPPAGELLLLLYDRVNWLRWAKTRDGAKGENYPESLYAKCMGLVEEDTGNVMSFDSGEDFEEMLQRIKRGEING